MGFVLIGHENGGRWREKERETKEGEDTAEYTHTEAYTDALPEVCLFPIPMENNPLETAPVARGMWVSYSQ